MKTAYELYLDALDLQKAPLIRDYPHTTVDTDIVLAKQYEEDFTAALNKRAQELRVPVSHLGTADIIRLCADRAAKVGYGILGRS